MKKFARVIFAALVICMLALTLSACELFGGKPDKTYTVMFNSNGGSTVNDILGREGEQIEKPANPVNGDKIFGGWYNDYDTNFTEEVIFPITLDEDYSLRAKWNDKAKFDGVTFDDKTVTYNGERQAVTVTGAPEGTDIQYTDNAGVNAGTYEATAVLQLVGYETKTLEALLTIDKAVINLSIPYNVLYTYDGTEKTVYADFDIPDTVEVSYTDDTTGTNAGTYSSKAAFTPKDPANYTVSIISRNITMTIQKARSIEGITFEDLSVPYDGSTKMIELSGAIPDGITPEYWHNNKRFLGATASGDYTVNAYIRNNNYDCAFSATLYIVSSITTPQGLELKYINGATEFEVIKRYSSQYSGVEEFNIPAEYDGRPITAIGDSAFSGCFSLTNITIPDSVKSIGDYAFYETRLADIELSENLESIGDDAFRDTVIASLDIPDSVKTIGNRAFYNCDALVTATVGNGVTDIGETAFANCAVLKDIVIGTEITAMEGYVLSNCPNLENVTILAEIPPFERGGLIEGSGKASIYVPASVLDAYKNNSVIGTQYKNRIYAIA